MGVVCPLQYRRRPALVPTLVTVGGQRQDRRQDRGPRLASKLTGHTQKPAPTSGAGGPWVETGVEQFWFSLGDIRFRAKIFTAESS